jgi:cytochrome c-type biogenesis protein CcmH/NrfG
LQEDLVGPSYWKEISELGQNELSNRIQKSFLIEIANLRQEITLLKDDNKVSGRINKWLSILTITLAVITGYIGYLSLGFTKTSKSEEKTDEFMQSETLKANNQILDSIYIELKRISVKKEKAEDSNKK